MNSVKVAIIGAGVSGLYAASMLESAGISYALLEGRSAPGGRVLSLAPDTEKSGKVDLGPGWVWPSLQPQLAALLAELGIALIPQHESGEMLNEQTKHNAPSRHPGYRSSPSSMRLAGGMDELTRCLLARISAERLYTDKKVQEISLAGERVHIHATASDGMTLTVEAETVLLALPPALAAEIIFTPALPETTHGEWARTGTWMAPHAKYFAVYSENFWHGNALSGEARSSVGPMVEIHDASVPGGISALFGFLGVSARSRRTISEAKLLRLCREQMVRLFGRSAAYPIAEYYKDWASDPFTATEYDLTAQAGHFVPASEPATGPWQTRIKGIASEWSAAFPGYLAGAVENAVAGFNFCQKS